MLGVATLIKDYLENESSKSQHRLDEKESAMKKREEIVHILAYVAAGVSALCMLLGAISRLSRHIILVQQGTYLAVAVVTILFAIFFLVEILVYQARRNK